MATEIEVVNDVKMSAVLEEEQKYPRFIKIAEFAISPVEDIDRYASILEIKLLCDVHPRVLHIYAGGELRIAIADEFRWIDRDKFLNKNFALKKLSEGTAEFLRKLAYEIPPLKSDDIWVFDLRSKIERLNIESAVAAFKELYREALGYKWLKS